MVTDPIFILSVLGLLIAASEWLVRNTALRHLGSALLVIVLTAIVANAGLIPTYSPDQALYGAILEYVAPLAIFWLLLQVNLRSVLRAGGTVIATFLVGSAATFAGVLVGMSVIGGAQTFGEKHAALGGMFVGTYTGGSVNFNAVALHFGVAEDGLLFAGATAVDSLMTTLWMAVTLLVPRLLRRLGARSSAPAAESRGALLGVDDDTETVHPIDLGWLLAIGAGCVWLSARVEAATGAPSILALTTLALVLAQVPALGRLRGSRLLGMFAVYLFLAVIGALCDVAALRGIGELGAALLTMVSIAIVVHGLVTFGLATVARVDPDVAAVASQANVGGGTSALALARSLGRGDLVLPAILVGALGSALGTYLGFAAAAVLG